MQEDTTITATEALHWIAFREAKTFEEINRELNQRVDGHFLQDKLIWHYLRHKTKKAAWPPRFLSRKEWLAAEELANAQLIPQQVAAYKKKTKTDWRTLRKQSLNLMLCSRAYKSAEHKLLTAARKKSLVLYGIQRSSDGNILGARAEIPCAVYMADDWTLKVYTNELQHNPKPPHKRNPSWADLRLEMRTVRTIWPPRKKGQGEKTPPASAEEIARYLQEYTMQNGGTLPSRDDCCAAAAKYFGSFERVAQHKTTRQAHKQISDNPKKYGLTVRKRGKPAKR